MDIRFRAGVDHSSRQNIYSRRRKSTRRSAVWAAVSEPLEPRRFLSASPGSAEFSAPILSLQKPPRSAFHAAAVAPAASHPPHLTINPTYDSSVTSLPNAAAIESAFSYAVLQYENLFTANATINIEVAAVPGTGVLGQSQTFIQPFSYATIRSALLNRSPNLTLPATDPTGNGTWEVATAQAKALQLADSTNIDGIFTFGTGFTYTFDPNNRAVSGAFDFIGVAEHEISEIMGEFLDWELIPFISPTTYSALRPPACTV